MPETAKVITLDPVLSANARDNLAKLPTAIDAARHKSLMVIQALLNHFYEASLDALFTEANASEDLDRQTSLFNAGQRFREQQTTFSQQYISGINAGFAQLIQKTTENPVTQEPQAWQIPFESALNDCLAQNEAILASIKTRFTHLIPEATRIEIPIGLEQLGELFVAQLTRLQLPDMANGCIVNCFCDCFFEHFPSVYHAIETLLDEHNVPRAKELDSHFASKHISRLRHRKSNHRKASTHSEASVIVESVLGNTATPYKLSHKELLTLLNVAQRELSHATTIDSNVSLGNILKHAQKSLKISGQIAQYDKELIKLITVMFDLVTRNPNLEPIVKSYINRLLVPVIKVGMIDKTFFALSQHTVRELLNALVLSGLGWQQRQDPTQRCPIIQEINAITLHIADNFGINTSIFDEALKRLQIIQQSEERQNSLLSTRLAGTTQGKAKALQAEKEVDKTIDQCLSRLKPPQLIKVFATTLWNKVLLISALKQGLGSKLWQEQYSLLEEVCHLVTPCLTPDDKRHRIQRLPHIIPNIQKGVATCAHSAFDTAEILDALHTMLCSCLQGKNAEQEYALQHTHAQESPTPGSIEIAHPAAISLAAGTPNDNHSNNEQAAKTLPTHPIDLGGSINNSINNVISKDLSGSEATFSSKDIHLDENGSERKHQDLNNDLINTIRKFPRGALFDWQDHAGGVIRCRLAAIIKQPERFIFINRNGIRVVEMSIENTLAAIKSHQLIPIEHSMVFDRALEEVVSGIRRNQQDGPMEQPSS